MKALVCVKRVVDYNVKIRVKPDNSAVDLANVKMSGQRHSWGSVKQNRRGTKGADQEEDVLLLELNQMSQESDCKNSEKGSNPGNQNFFQ